MRQFDVLTQREPFPPIRRLPTYPARGFLGIAVIVAFFGVLFAWGWLIAVGAFAALVVLLLASAVAIGLRNGPE